MRKSFTMVEMLITVVILGILATTAIAGYQGMMAKSLLQKDKVGAMILLQAAKMYDLENDKSPASLAAIDQRYYERAYAQVLNTPLKRLAFELESKMQNAGTAYAADHGTVSTPCAADSLCGSAKKYGLTASQFTSAKDPSVYFVFTDDFVEARKEGNRVPWNELPKNAVVIAQSKDLTNLVDLGSATAVHTLNGKKVSVVATLSGVGTAVAGSSEITMQGASTTTTPVAFSNKQKIGGHGNNPPI